MSNKPLPQQDTKDDNPKIVVTNKNEELFIKKFIEANEKLRELLPELHDSILGLSLFTKNQIQISNAWTNFKQMDFWISVVMKEGFEQMQRLQATTTTTTENNKSSETRE